MSEAGKRHSKQTKVVEAKNHESRERIGEKDKKRQTMETHVFTRAFS